jgi:hypothetical protein
MPAPWRPSHENFTPFSRRRCENGITALLVLTGNCDYAGQIGLADLTQVLSRHYGLELQDQLGATLWQRLAAWAALVAQPVSSAKIP